MTNHPHRLAKDLRPLQHLITAGKIYPEAWQKFDMFRAMRGKDGLSDWPEWCYCPLAAAYAIVSGGGNNRVALGDAKHIAGLGALAAWRVSQSVYRFDPALAAALAETEVDRLPVEVLYRLPEWCVYIETPGLAWGGSVLQGFFAHLEHDAVSGRPELRLLLDVDEDDHPNLIGVPLHINTETLDEAVAAMLAESKRQMFDQGKTMIASAMPTEMAGWMAGQVRPLLGMLLYLCSEQPDVEGGMPQRPVPTRTKKGWRLFPPDTPRVVTVGSRIGAALREAYLDEQIGSMEDFSGERWRPRPRPHIRRAHWHTFLTGPGRSVGVLRWLPPLGINIDLGEIPATVRDLKL